MFLNYVYKIPKRVLRMCECNTMIRIKYVFVEVTYKYENKNLPGKQKISPCFWILSSLSSLAYMAHHLNNNIYNLLIYHSQFLLFCHSHCFLWLSWLLQLYLKTCRKLRLVSIVIFQDFCYLVTGYRVK